MGVTGLTAASIATISTLLPSDTFTNTVTTTSVLKGIGASVKDIFAYKVTNASGYTAIDVGVVSNALGTTTGTGISYQEFGF